jgi:hypothetical protein
MSARVFRSGPAYESQATKQHGLAFDHTREILDGDLVGYSSKLCLESQLGNHNAVLTSLPGPSLLDYQCMLRYSSEP